MPSRIASPRRRRAFYLLLVAGAVTGMASLALVLASQITDNRQSLNAACVQVQRLERVIRAVLVQSLHTLGAKGGPGYAYYLAHPAELAAARVSVQREIVQFTQRRC